MTMKAEAEQKQEELRHLATQMESQKQDMVRDLLRQRIAGNADWEEHVVRYTEIDNEKIFSIGGDESDENDDSDSDYDGTIYSRADVYPTTSDNISDDSPSSSSLSTDSHCAAPSSLQSSILQYTSFSWADDVEESINATEEITVAIRPAHDMTMTSQIANLPVTSLKDFNASEKELAFRAALAQIVGEAWLKYERERQAGALENNRTLGCSLAASWLLPINSYCAWKWSPLTCSLESHKEEALSRFSNGRCPSERIPSLIVTDELGNHYKLLEVRKVLSEKEIVEIRSCRAQALENFRRPQGQYDVWSTGKQEGQTEAERLTADAARAWWNAEQEKLNGRYKGWEHEEVEELALLKQQLRQEVDEYFESLEKSKAVEKEQHRLKKSKMAETRCHTVLRLRMARDSLHPRGDGLWTGNNYSAKFTDMALKASSMIHDRIRDQVCQLLGWGGKAKKARRSRQNKLNNTEILERQKWARIKENRRFQMRLRRLAVFDDKDRDEGFDYDVPTYDRILSMCIS